MLRLFFALIIDLAKNKLFASKLIFSQTLVGTVEATLCIGCSFFSCRHICRTLLSKKVRLRNSLTLFNTNLEDLVQRDILRFFTQFNIVLLHDVCCEMNLLSLLLSHVLWNSTLCTFSCFCSVFFRSHNYWLEEVG